MIECRKCVKCKTDMIVPNLQTKYCRPCAKEENRIRCNKRRRKIRV